MLRIILLLLIFFVLYKIYNTSTEPFINITNPFVNGLSQFQLGNSPDYNSYLNLNDKPSSNKNVINRINTLSTNNNFKISKNNKNYKNSKNSKNIKNSKKCNMVNNISNNISTKKSIILPQKKLNKFFMQTQFNDSYRDVLTAFFTLSPDQKTFFNLQSLPVITTTYKIDNNVPVEFIKLITHFVSNLNEQINKLPDSYDIVNTYNNYLPLTSQMNKYVKDKGINKFYKSIGVNYNLYADTPPNSPVELIQILKLTREYTEAETKYVVTMVLKKILKSVSDQIQITVHFITKNDPLDGYNLFDNTKTPQNINSVQNVAIEFIFVDGFFTNDFNVDYDAVETQNTKKVSNIDGDDKFYSFDALNQNNMLSDNEIIKEFNKKLKQHDLEMNNFNINVPYPIYSQPQL